MTVTKLKLIMTGLIICVLSCSNSDQISKTVVIGHQEWMTENLNVDTFRNGDPIVEVRTNEEWVKAGEEERPAWCYYENDPENGNKYGKLYNWFAVIDPRGLAPEGWHIPTEEEWQELEMTLGLSPAVGDTQGWFGTDQGTQLKSTIGWNENGNGNNSRGFNALPSGLRSYDGNFYLIGYGTEFWSSTPFDSNYVWYRALQNNKSQIRRKLGTKIRGFPVRCIRD